MKTGSKLAIIVFILVSVGHLLRLLLGINMSIGNWNVPQWVGVLGTVGPAVIATMLWRESR